MGEVLTRGLLALIEVLYLVVNLELSFGPSGQARHQSSGVGEKDSIKSQSCSLNWVVVHISPFINYNLNIPILYILLL